MKIALTGGSGGLGRAITADALRQGHSIVSIDRVAPDNAAPGEDVSYVVADVADYDRLAEAFTGCDALIHMAAIPAPSKDFSEHFTHNNNVVGSYNALQAAVECGISRVCQASSVNAIGLAFSREPHFDYFPIDEKHANYCEEPYSLSKWICEQQADSFVRRYENMRIASMRFHWVVPDRETAAQNFNADPDYGKHLWAYTLFADATRACLLSLEAPFEGHEVFYITAPNTTIDTPSLELAAKHFPHIPIQGNLSGNRSFFDCKKAEQILKWYSDASAN